MLGKLFGKKGREARLALLDRNCFYQLPHFQAFFLGRV